MFWLFCQIIDFGIKNYLVGIILLNTIIKQIKNGGIFMKFMGGLIIGSMVGTGIALMYSENKTLSGKKLMKKGKQIVKKIGMY